MNLRPLGYEPSELPSCSTPRRCDHTTSAPANGANPLGWGRQVVGTAAANTSAARPPARRRSVSSGTPRSQPGDGKELILLTKRIVGLAIAAAAAVTFALPATPAHAHCIYLGTFEIVCPPTGS